MRSPSGPGHMPGVRSRWIGRPRLTEVVEGPILQGACLAQGNEELQSDVVRVAKRQH
jgi:hypothetical protein